jgi:hypothetical protein
MATCHGTPSRRAVRDGRIGNRDGGTGECDGGTGECVTARMLRERSAAMLHRVLERAAKEALSRNDLTMIEHALSAALLLRDAVLEDDHDIDALHPARTVLILLDDARMTDPATLAAAALLESGRDDLAVAVDHAPIPDHVRAIHARIPTPRSHDKGDLLEALLGLEGDLLDVALAERLDHARHLHLRDRALWAAGFRLEEEIYLPLAERRGGLVGRRYARWHGAFAKRMAAAGVPRG